MKHLSLFFAACAFVFGAGVVYAQELTAPPEAPSVEVLFFYSETCPHCIAEQAFLDDFEQKYPEVTVSRYPVSDPAHVERMRVLLEERGAGRYFGTVPITIIGDDVISGFSTAETTGLEIEQTVLRALGREAAPAAPKTFRVPFVGSIDPAAFSLPVLALVLGFLDGFNVCALGALVMIIGLALKLQRRRAIVLFGGAFVGITALTYGALIVLWYHLFTFVGPYIGVMKVGIMLLSLGGGLYFLKEYLRMRKQGAVCELSESPLIARLSAHTAHAFTDKTALLSLLGLVALFALVVAVVEFPCSAAVPVAFAALLADAGVSTVSYLTHIALYVFMYMLDELIIFGVAAWRLKLWMTSGSFTKWAVLAEAFILLGIGVWYAVALL